MARLCFGRQDQLDDQVRATRSFSYETLRIATINFSDHMLIGEGGWARVYRGVLPDGTRIAVKNYSQGQTQDLDLTLGDVSKMQGSFLIWCWPCQLSSIQHRNIHQVIGYCIHYDSWLLVSEYADNGSLHDLLNSQENRESVFNWPMRVAVCIGIARGLSHLHEDANPRAVHRDIKPGNILLDTNFNPKITDFDTVTFFFPEAAVATRSDDFNSGSDFFTEVSTLEGTPGYMPPEYVQYGILTHKVDVYSFGVTMLEIISGRRLFPENVFKAIAEYFSFRRPYPDIEAKEKIVVWASDLLRDGRVLEIIDPVLSDFPTDVVQRFIEVAYLCVNEQSELRPSMHEVMQMLDGGCSSSRIQFLLTHYDVHYSCVRERYVHDAYMSELYAEMMEDVLMRQDDDDDDDDDDGDETFIEQEEREQEHGTSARVNMLVSTCTSTESGEITADSSTTLEQNKPGIVDHIVERPYRTMVFKKKFDFPEAVYPPFLASVYRPIRPRPSFGFHRTRSYRRPFP